MNDLFDTLSQEDHTTPRLSRQQRRALAAKKKREAARRRKSLIAVFFAVLIFGGGIAFAWSWGVEFFNGLSFNAPRVSEVPADYEGEGTEAVEVTVNEGDTGAAIATTLVAADVVASEGAFVSAANAHPDAAGIQPGTYTLYKKIPASKAVEMLLDLNNLSGNRVQVIPGMTVKDVIQKMKAVTGFSDDQINAALDNTEATGLPEQAEGSYEGWLADGDYRFSADVTPEEMFADMVARQRKRLADMGVKKADWERTLKIASIVQLEGRNDDFPNIASVIENRLDIDMKLQMDSTVHYVHGGRGNASTTSAERADDNPWNTYKYKGLPKTPIGSPSAAAIEAVLNPPSTDYLFFVTVNPNSGETKFAETWSGHEANVAEYQQWLRDNEEAMTQSADGDS